MNEIWTPWFKKNELEWDGTIPKVVISMPASWYKCRACGNEARSFMRNPNVYCSCGTRMNEDLWCKS